MIEDSSAKLSTPGHPLTAQVSSVGDGVDARPTPSTRHRCRIADLTRQLDEATKGRDTGHQLDVAAALIDQYRSLFTRLLDEAVGPVMTFGDGAEGMFCRIFAALPGLHTRITTSSQAVDAFIVHADDTTVRYQRLDEHDNPSGPALTVLVSQIERVHVY